MKYKDLLSLNTGKHGSDQTFRGKNHPLLGIVQNMRIFYQMEDDYGDGTVNYNPLNSKPVISEYGVQGGKNNLVRWGDFSKHFTLTAAPMCFDGTSGFPNRFWTEAHIAGSPPDYKLAEENSYVYWKEWFEYYDGIFTYVEVGNEPWNTGTAALKSWIDGFLRAFREVSPSVKIGLCAFRFDEPLFGANDFIEDIYPDVNDIPEDFDFISIHAYHFKSKKNLNKGFTFPENIGADGNQNLSALYEYNKGRFPIHIGELGWDSDPIGELSQAAYTLRALLYYSAPSSGIEKVTFYEDVDLNGSLGSGVGRYESSGWFEAGEHRSFGDPKLVARVMIKFMKNFSEFGPVDYWFDSESRVFLITITNGLNTFQAVWLATKNPSEYVYADLAIDTEEVLTFFKTPIPHCDGDSLLVTGFPRFYKLTNNCDIRERVL